MLHDGKATRQPGGVRLPLRIPLARPLFSAAEEEAVARVLRSGWVTQGKAVAGFEEAIASYVGAQYAVAVTSCTTALHLGLLAAGIGPGDEVIAPAFSFVASANAVLHAGATCRLVDVDLHTYNIDPGRVEAALTPRTRAIIPVHQFGLPADLDPLRALAESHGLILIEDAACALGAEYRGRRIGATAKACCFSFHPRKVITTGEGGMITTDDRALADRARALRSHGASVSDLNRHGADEVVIENYPMLGYNFRLTDIQAAIGLEQMAKLDELLRARRRVAERYEAALARLPDLRSQRTPPGAVHCHQSYVVRVAGTLEGRRDALMARLRAEGIATRRGAPAIHREPFYVARYGPLHLPASEKLADSTLTLPLYPGMTEEELDYVIGRLTEACAEILGG